MPSDHAWKVGDIVARYLADGRVSYTVKITKLFDGAVHMSTMGDGGMREGVIFVWRLHEFNDPENRMRLVRSAIVETKEQLRDFINNY